MTSYSAEEAGRLYFTSDTHFGHANIISFTGRPFTSVRMMDEALIKNWNETVPKNGIVWHLGDFGFSNIKHVETIFNQLNGTINFLFGNHDRGMRKKMMDRLANQENLVKNRYVYTIEEIDVHDPTEHFKQRIVMCHFPIRSWHHMHRGVWHLHGHCHGSLETPASMKRLDVGVEKTDYKPISYSKLKGIMDAKPPFVPVDHHGKSNLGKEY